MMSWRVLPFVACVLAGCSKPAEVAPPSASTSTSTSASAPRVPAPAPPLVATSATAGECAAILQNVQAGRDIVVNVQCDTPTEAKFIAALSSEKWDVLCPHVMPVRGWLTKNSELAINADIVPVPGSYWSQYGFRISVLPTELSQKEFVYVHALRWEGTPEQVAIMDSATYANMQGVARLYPPAPAAISWQAAELLRGDDTRPMAEVDASLRKRIVDQLALRRELAYEDGSKIDTLKLAVFQDDDTLLTEVTLLPYFNEFPSWGNYDPVALRLSCRANKDVPLRTFKSLCTLFLERQSMSAKTTTGAACEARREAASQKES